MNNDINFSIYVANLGKYNEGELIGEWISLPFEEYEFNSLLDSIGINEKYEEYFIADYDCGSIYGFDIDLEVGEYQSIDGLNEAFKIIKSLYEFYGEDVLLVIKYIRAEYGNSYTWEYISNLTVGDIDDYTIIEDVSNFEELGIYTLQDLHCIDEDIIWYFDHERFAKDHYNDYIGSFIDGRYVYTI